MTGRVEAVLLAGGLARRFGADKAAAPWRGRPLAAHVLAALPPCPRVLVLRRPGDPAPTAADRIVHDDPALPPGPVRGVIAGLEACRAPHAWVLACDLPRLRPALLAALRAACRPGDAAVVPRWAGRLQPLCGFYAASSAADLRAALADGVDSLQAALRRLPCRVLDEASVRRVDPRGESFLNVNTPAALAGLDPSEAANA